MQRVSRREDHKDVQGQTRQQSKLINLPRKKQICICVNKTDCDTADNKQVNFERDEERVEQDDELDRAPTTRRDVGANGTNV